ncbi:plasmid mobilization relaxosome protein MobC [Pedobacter sp. ISL-68]|uniref:plasmid mobilization protein n=1 Tax=unclassified Pedobacter TaxID=2628915 RepID=UPI001BE89927|nr:MULTISPECIES: plasmid mobilization relaxosome protein MobC [unclassified Pedobacter]MBT2561338.1 plasmid mobilization relaxosome protein MobC [Pedobacter sp. ISL-64]MBT2590727.1 plasmid mobilization relaxosome protein MobC [Pedobacter sp. ISL-68]
MKEQKNNRNKWLHVRVTEAELEAILKAYSKTTSPKFSDFLRRQVLAKPHIGKYRNESLNDFVTVLAGLKMELKAAGNNLNQAVKKLHTLNHRSELERWLVTWELDKRSFQKSVESITRHMDKINDQWLR